MIASPCLECEFKGCGSHHDLCEEYQDFVREQNAYRKARQKEGSLNTHNNLFDPRKKPRESQR